MKSLIKSLLPQWLLLRIRKLRERMMIWRMDTAFAGQDSPEIFSGIYEKRWWGGSNSEEYNSGHGSRDEIYVKPYLKAVQTFLKTLPTKPNIVDLGCGDFYVGRQLVELAQTYTACDVVASLIASHRSTHESLGVDFRVVDITRDNLPEGDVALVRQVLQHLSNERIQGFVDNIRKSNFKYLIVAEYLPKGEFQPNLDQPSGVHSRMARGVGSGVVLTEDPFNLQPLNEIVISDTEDDAGHLKTILYQLG